VKQTTLERRPSANGISVASPCSTVTLRSSVRRSPTPTVAPIQTRVQNAVGQHHEIVVIFD